MNLAEKLVCLRKEKGMTQSALAELIHVSRQAVSRWETGDALPSTENLKYLSSLYDIPLDYLLNDGAQKPEKEDEPPSAGKAPGRVHMWSKWVWIAAGAALLVIVFLLFITFSARPGAKRKEICPIGDLEQEEVNPEDLEESPFYFEW